jgi:hypothetical protein
MSATWSKRVAQPWARPATSPAACDSVHDRSSGKRSHGMPDNTRDERVRRLREAVARELERDDADGERDLVDTVTEEQERVRSATERDDARGED